jgi:uncharacterized protein YdeI (YjbR/CyaY-like superfamily)
MNPRLSLSFILKDKKSLPSNLFFRSKKEKYRCVKKVELLYMNEQMDEKDIREILHIHNRGSWRTWLQNNHALSTGVWLVVSKKKSSTPAVLYDEAVEEALCFGWIDSQLQKSDEESYLLWMSPRKPGSIWSLNNKRRIEKLTKKGVMTAAGLQKINAAKKDGSWDVIDDIETLTIPDDLQQALEHNRQAMNNFTSFPASSKKMLLFWILSAKKSETRAKRIQQTVTLAAQNIKPVYQPKVKK